MITMFSTWTDAQWTAFSVILTLGLAALTAATAASRRLRGWAVPIAPRAYAPTHARPRPTITRAAARVPLHHVMMSYGDPVYTPTIIAEHGDTALWLAPTEQQHVLPLDEAAAIAPGPGSITSILAVEPDDSLISEHEKQVRDDAWASALAPEFAERFDALQRGFDAAMAPAMAKVMLWAAEGAMAGVSGAARLMEWHTDTPTGEWPVIERATRLGVLV